jgi:hypothetical protein
MMNIECEIGTDLQMNIPLVTPQHSVNVFYCVLGICFLARDAILLRLGNAPRRKPV